MSGSNRSRVFLSPQFNLDPWAACAEACYVVADPDNPAVKEKLAWAKAQRAEGKLTIPSSIGVRPLLGPAQLLKLCTLILLQRRGQAAWGMG